MYDLARKFARTDGGDCIWRFIISYSLNCLSLSVLDASLYHCARWSLLFHSHDGIAQQNLQAKGYGFSRIRMRCYLFDTIGLAVADSWGY